MDDDSNAFANAVALQGVSSLAPGQSAVFIEGTAATAAAFRTAWFGAAAPAGLLIGTYSGSGVGLSTGGDAVNVFDSAGRRVTGVRFGTSTTGVSFDDASALGGPISTLSVLGRNGAFRAADGQETGSPGTVSAGAQSAVSGTVPATLSLALGPPASFGALAAGVAHTYAAASTATVTSSAGDAA